MELDDLVKDESKMHVTWEFPRTDETDGWSVCMIDDEWELAKYAIKAVPSDNWEWEKDRFIGKKIWETLNKSGVPKGDFRAYVPILYCFLQSKDPVVTEVTLMGFPGEIPDKPYKKKLKGPDLSKRLFLVDIHEEGKKPHSQSGPRLVAPILEELGVPEVHWAFYSKVFATTDETAYSEKETYSKGEMEGFGFKLRESRVTNIVEAFLKKWQEWPDYDLYVKETYGTDFHTAGTITMDILNLDKFWTARQALKHRCSYGVWKWIETVVMAVKEDSDLPRIKLAWLSAKLFQKLGRMKNPSGSYQAIRGFTFGLANCVELAPELVKENYEGEEKGRGMDEWKFSWFRGEQHSTCRYAKIGSQECPAWKALNSLRKTIEKIHAGDGARVNGMRLRYESQDLRLTIMFTESLEELFKLETQGETTKQIKECNKMLAPDLDYNEKDKAVTIRFMGVDE